jgi:hypothetical protein
VRVGEGVAVNGFACSVCLANARAVLARDVSTPGGFVIGVGVFWPQAVNKNRSTNVFHGKVSRFGFMVSSVMKSLPKIIRPKQPVFY